jgi:hypothetical protein
VIAAGFDVPEVEVHEGNLSTVIGFFAYSKDLIRECGGEIDLATSWQWMRPLLPTRSSGAPCPVPRAPQGVTHVPGLIRPPCTRSARVSPMYPV